MISEIPLMFDEVFMMMKNRRELNSYAKKVIMNNNISRLTFDAIKIGLASPEKILRVVKRRGYQTGDDQLQNVETGKRRSVL